MASLSELRLVRGVTPELFYDKLREYITVHGDGRININTAPEKVLDAAVGIGYPELASKLVDYSKGVDGKAGAGQRPFRPTVLPVPVPPPAYRGHGRGSSCEQSWRAAHSAVYGESRVAERGSGNGG